LELFAATVDRAFSKCSGRKLPRPDVFEADLDAVRDALDLFDDGVG